MLLWAGIFLFLKRFFRGKSMESQEKTLSLYFDAAPNEAAGAYPHADRTGVIASIAIHLIFMLFFVLQPTVKTAAVKTFHISFAEVGASVLKSPAAPTAEVKTETASLAPPMKKHPPPAQPQKAAITPNPVTTAPASVRQDVIEPPPAVEPRDTETALPPVSQSAPNDEFIASTVSLPASGAATSGQVSSDRGAAAGAVASAGESGGGHGSGMGTGNGHGSGVSTRSGNWAPLETSFGAMNAPSFIHRAMPVYPPLARRRGKEGRVVLALLIDQAGKVQKIDVLEPAGYGLTEASIEAVNRSTFAPARVNGTNVASRAVLPIRFKLEQ
jgi:protein TonB